VCVQEPCIYLLSAASVVIRNTSDSARLSTQPRGYVNGRAAPGGHLPGFGGALAPQEGAVLVLVVVCVLVCTLHTFIEERYKEPPNHWAPKNHVLDKKYTVDSSLLKYGGINVQVAKCSYWTTGHNLFSRGEQAICVPTRSPQNLPGHKKPVD
jgi:hypothetical protein